MIYAELKHFDKKIREIENRVIWRLCLFLNEETNLTIVFGHNFLIKILTLSCTKSWFGPFVCINDNQKASLKNDIFMCN